MLNKSTGEVNEAALLDLEATLRALNPNARMIRASYGRVELREVLGKSPSFPLRLCCALLVRKWSRCSSHPNLWRGPQ